jgi:hypothetical protein
MKAITGKGALCAAVVFLWGSVLAAAGELPGGDSVWTYMTFDGTTDALLPPEGFRHVEFSGGDGDGPQFVPGRAGRAFRVSESGGTLSVTPGLTDFPLAEGSLTLWFRPEADLSRESRWLVFGNWASFDVHIAGGRMLAYATGNSRHLVAGDLRPYEDRWADRWHHLVLTWNGSVRALYLDGEMIGQREEVASMKRAPHRLAFGYLPGSRTKPARAFLNGALDEFAILRGALSADQVATLFGEASETDYKGLLASLGGAVIVGMQRSAFVRGERAVMKVKPYARGERIRLLAVPRENGAPVQLAVLPCQPADYALDTSEVRPGRYRIRCELLRDDEVVLTDERARLAVRAERRPEFPVGLDGLLAYDDAMLERAEDWYITHTSHGGFYDTKGFHKDLDRLFSYGLSYFPCLNIHYQKALPLPGDGWFDPKTGRGTEKLREWVLQVMVLHGDRSFTPYSTSLASPLSKVARRAMAERVRGVIAAADGHPGLQFLAFDDEYELRIGTDKETGKRFYGGYAPDAREYFRERTGLDPVFPPEKPPGTVLPDTHPYFKWRDVVGMPGDATTSCLAVNNAELTGLVHDLRPDIKTTTWSGGEYGNVDAVMDYTYPTIWQPHPGYAQGFGRLDFQMDLHRARQRVEPLKPLWGLLGWWSDDLRGKPDWCVQGFRLNTILGLAKGVKLITWFTTYDPKREAGQFGGGILSREDLREEMIKWAGWIHRYGGMFARLEARPSGKVAVLYSEDNRVGNILRRNRPITPGWFYPCLRIAGVPVDVICDEDVEEGRLEGYDALILYGFDYASQSLWGRIQAFAGTEGKRVFVDEKTDLIPDGATELGIDVLAHAPMKGRPWGMAVIHDTYEMFVEQTRAELRPQLGRFDTRLSGSNFVAPHWLYGGDGRLVCLVNYHIHDRQSVTVEVDVEPGMVVYELEGGKVVAEAGPDERTLSWDTTVGKAGGKMYVLLPARAEDVQTNLEYREGEFAAEVTVEDADGNALRAPLPVHLQFVDPNGKAVPAYERFTATQPGRGVAGVRFQRAGRMDPAGEWKVIATELITGKKATARVRVH